MAKYDRNPVPHRHLKKGMRGKDVLRAQEAINLRLKRKGSSKRADRDGEWGPQSQECWTLAATLIGLPHNKPTVRCQAIMRKPSLRTPAMRARSKREVRAWRDGTPGERAIAAANRMVGKTETGQNDAIWLRRMEDQLPHNRLDWMIPGQPYCGFGCIWAWWVAVKALLPDGCVYTPNICGWGGKTIAKVKFVRCRPEDARPGALVVMNFGSGGAKHVALARGPMRGGQIPTTEFNTSPGNAGSQANGGGVWKRSRPRGFVLCTLNPVPIS